MTDTPNKFKLLKMTDPSVREIIDYIRDYDCAEARDALLTTDGLRKYYCVVVCKERPVHPRAAFRSKKKIPQECILLPDCWCRLGWPVQKDNGKEYFASD